MLAQLFESAPIMLNSCLVPTQLRCHPCMSLHANSSVFVPAFYKLLLTDLAADAVAPSITFTEDSIVWLAWALLDCCMEPAHLPLSSCLSLLVKCSASAPTNPPLLHPDLATYIHAVVIPSNQGTTVWLACALLNGCMVPTQPPLSSLHGFACE
jgi:hypothetical protein